MQQQQQQQRHHHKQRHALLCVLALLISLAMGIVTASPARDGDTWAVLVCTSRFWFNYRHVANALSFYRLVKRLGVPDSHIVLMLADDMPCNARNARPGTVYQATKHDMDLCGEGLEIDYKGDEVTVDNFLRVLTGRHPPGWPRSKQLLSSNTSRVLLYMTGHGGDGFLKFHNHEEIGSEDLAHALHEVRAAGRFQELFFIVDTCQGGTLLEPFHTPGILAVGSSGRGQNSYAHQNDLTLGVALIDRFTDVSCQYMHRLADGGEKMGGSNKELGPVLSHLQEFPLEALLRSFNPTQLKSTPVLRTDLFVDTDPPSQAGGQEEKKEEKVTKPKVARTQVDHFFSQARPIRLVELFLDADEEKHEGEEDKATDAPAAAAAAAAAAASSYWHAIPLREEHIPPPVEVVIPMSFSNMGNEVEEAARAMHAVVTLAVCAVSWVVLLRRES